MFISSSKLWLRACITLLLVQLGYPKESFIQSSSSTVDPFIQSVLLDNQMRVFYSNNLSDAHSIQSDFQLHVCHSVNSHFPLLPKIICVILLLDMQANKVVDSENEEAASLQKEFEWILTEEVHAVLSQLHIILLECIKRFPLPLYGSDSPNSAKQEKYVLTSPPDQLKTVVSINGDSIAQADIQFRIQRPHQQAIVYRTYIQSEHPWKLSQLQDAGNHVREALLHIDSIGKRCSFCSSEEVLHILGKILGCLQRGKTCLVVPRKKRMDEIIKSGNMKCLFPTLPEDVAVTFYVQSHKLILAVYQSTTSRGSTIKHDAFQAECSVPWLNEVLVLFTVALQLCQQLKDKICVFAQYKDFTIESRPRRRSSISIRT